MSRTPAVSRWNGRSRTSARSRSSWSCATWTPRSPVERLGAPVVTSGGVPVSFGTSPKVRAVIVKDPDGHFVQLTQPDPVPPATVPDPPNIIGVRVRLTIENREGHAAVSGRSRHSRPDARNVQQRQGRPESPGREGRTVPPVPRKSRRQACGSTSSISRASIAGPSAPRFRIPGSTRMQLRCATSTKRLAMLKRDGGAVVSTGGTRRTPRARRRHDEGRNSPRPEQLVPGVYSGGARAAGGPVVGRTGGLAGLARQGG